MTGEPGEGPPFASGAEKSEPLAARVATLERTVAELERRLADVASPSPRPAPAQREPSTQFAPTSSSVSAHTFRSTSGSAAASSIGARITDHAQTLDLETLIAGH
jgi:hypothetical protein